jgi:hypothetical protein
MHFTRRPLVSSAYTSIIGSASREASDAPPIPHPLIRLSNRYNWFDPVAITGISGGTSADARDAPSIHAPYYGALVVAEAISSSPNSTIVELASIMPHISAFGIYESGKLVRAVFVNSQVYMNASVPRERTTVELNGVDTRGARIRKMCAPLTTSTSGL